MEAKELRIGNLVNFEEEDEICEITTVNYNGLGVKIKDDITWIELYEFSPIKLTEEWLVKFGFFNNDDKFYIGEIGLYLDSNVWYSGEIINDNLKYVHQLQNLYFALTGKELILK